MRTLNVLCAALALAAAPRAARALTFSELLDASETRCPGLGAKIQADYPALNQVLALVGGLDSGVASTNSTGVPVVFAPDSGSFLGLLDEVNAKLAAMGYPKLTLGGTADLSPAAKAATESVVSQVLRLHLAEAPAGGGSPPTVTTASGEVATLTYGGPGGTLSAVSAGKTATNATVNAEIEDLCDGAVIVIDTDAVLLPSNLVVPGNGTAPAPAPGPAGEGGNGTTAGSGAAQLAALPAALLAAGLAALL